MAAWRAWGRFATAALASAAVGWVAFGMKRPVPVLDLFDLGMHEVGHLVTSFLPETVMFLAGSVAQVAVPLGLGAYFLFGRREWASAGFCVAWAGTSARDVAVYVADAPAQALPLIGGGTHDWAYLLGPGGFDCAGCAGSVANAVEIAGAVLVVAGLALCLWPLRARSRRRLRLGAGARRSARRRAVPRMVDPAGDPWLAGAPGRGAHDGGPGVPAGGVSRGRE